MTRRRATEMSCTTAAASMRPSRSTQRLSVRTLRPSTGAPEGSAPGVPTVGTFSLQTRHLLARAVIGPSRRNQPAPLEEARGEMHPCGVANAIVALVETRGGPVSRRAAENVVQRLRLGSAVELPDMSFVEQPVRIRAGADCQPRRRKARPTTKIAMTNVRSL